MGSSAAKAYAPVHNAPAAVSAKVALRQRALEFVGGSGRALVFDAFAGRGEMWRAVWSQSAGYVGVDKTWQSSDPGRRFVGDNRTVMRAIELGGFNVFDFDAFGSPWEQMVILAARRRWKRRERGAIVITDGASLKLRFGAAPAAMAQLCGIDGRSLPPKESTSDIIQKTALSAWCKKVGIKLVKMWRAEGNGSGKGGARMIYTCIGIEG
jgi:hypothetical protein